MNQIFASNSPRLSFDRGTLLLAGVAQDEARALFGQDLWTWDGRVGAWRCDALHYARVREALRGHPGRSIEDEVSEPVRVSWPKVDLPPLRPEQMEALAAWRQANGRGQIIMPTGTGKTEVALAAMAETKVATLVVAPIRDLMYQWHRRILKAFDYDAGIVGDNLYNSPRGFRASSCRYRNCSCRNCLQMGIAYRWNRTNRLKPPFRLSRQPDAEQLAGSERKCFVEPGRPQQAAVGTDPVATRTR